MNVLVLALLGSATTSLLLTIALTGAYLRFGGHAHAIRWAVAFSLITLFHCLIGLRVLNQGEGSALTLLSALTAISASTFIALGYRERSGWTGKRLILTLASVVATLCVTLILHNSGMPGHRPLVSCYVAVMFGFSIHALVGGRKDDLAPGTLTLVMMSVFAAVFIVLTALCLATEPLGPLGPDAYRLFYLLAVPASLIGVGMFSLFLLAEDLVHDTRRLAIVDPLTGLLNRRGFDEAARRIKAECRRERKSMCIAVADLDHFKAINDCYGHKSGDLVLREFARRLRSSLREGDLVSRSGGEEFVLLLPGMTEQTAQIMLDSLRRAIARPDDVALFGFPMPTVSFGAVEIHYSDSISERIEQADIALYLAKRDGRNCVRMFHTPVEDDIPDRAMATI